MQLGLVGLGRMGQNMAWRLAKAGHEVVVIDRDAKVLEETVAISRPDLTAETVEAIKKSMAQTGGKLTAAHTPEEVVKKLNPPRPIWLMIPAGITDRVMNEYAALLSPGDMIIDGGNSHYIDDIRRSHEMAAKQLHYLDVGTSGGVWGLERGYCLMIGGNEAAVNYLDSIFKILAPGMGTTEPSKSKKITGVDKDAKGKFHAIKTEEVVAGGTAPHGYLHCGPSGAGHFVKMVHNGIEYGLMAAYAEGLNILKHANIGKQEHRADSAEETPLRHPEHYQYDFDLGSICELWRRGSVVASWLLDLTAEALLENPELPVEQATVGAHGVPDSGEGRWTLLAAIDEGVPCTILSESTYSRFSSRHRENFAWHIAQAMRRKFGGH